MRNLIFFRTNICLDIIDRRLRNVLYFLICPPQNQPSILDKDPAAKAMLSLVGKGPVSEGLREQDAHADSPEEHQLPPL